MLIIRKVATVIFTVALCCAVVTSCARKEAGKTARTEPREKKWDQSEAERRYRLIQAELQLSESTKPYLALDFARKQIELRVQGAVVWNYPLQIEETNADELHDFVKRFMGDEQRLVRPLMFKYLFAAQSKTSDSILAIVSEATKVKTELLQRVIPERFQLLWDEDLILDIRTEVVGVPQSKFKNTLVEIRQALKRPFGTDIIIVKMPKDKALTLYRASDPGMPTLINPEG